MRFFGRSDRASREAGGLVRETFRHTAVYSGAGILGRVIGFLMLPLYAHALQDIGYGVIGMVEAGLAFLASLLAYNFNSAIVRMYHEQEDPDRKPLVVSTSAFLIAGAAVPIAVLGAAVSKPVAGLLLDDTSYWNLICLALGAFVLGLVKVTLLSYLTVTRRSGTFSLLSLVQLFVGVGSNVLFIVVLDWGLFGYFLSSLVTAIVMTTLALIVVGRHCPPTFDRAIAKDLVAFQLPLIPAALTRFVSNQIERVLVRFQIDLASVGVLEMAYRFPVLISFLFIAPFQKSWGTKRMEIADQPGARQHVGRMFSYFVYLVVFGFLLLAVNIESVLRLMTPSDFWGAALLAKVGAAEVVVKATMTHLSFGIVYAKRTDLAARAMIVTSIVKVGVSYAFISTWGLHGAAWAGLAIALVYGLWSWRMGWNFYAFSVPWVRVALTIATASALLVVDTQLSRETVARWGGPFTDFVQTMVQGLENTPIGTWKDGKLVTALVDRASAVFDLIVRTFIVSFYLLIMPLVHHETGDRIKARVRAFRVGAGA